MRNADMKHYAVVKKCGSQCTPKIASSPWTIVGFKPQLFDTSFHFYNF